MRGGNSKIYYAPTWVTWDSPKVAPAALVEIAEITDSNLDLNRVEIDRRTRASNHGGVSPGSIDPVGFSCTYLVETAASTDTVFSALHTAWLAGAKLTFAYLDGPDDTVGTTGWYFEGYVTTEPRTDPYDGETSVTFTVKLAADRAVDPEYVVVAAP